MLAILQGLRNAQREVSEKLPLGYHWLAGVDLKSLLATQCQLITFSMHTPHQLFLHVTVKANFSSQLRKDLRGEIEEPHAGPPTTGAFAYFFDDRGCYSCEIPALCPKL